MPVILGNSESVLLHLYTKRGWVLPFVGLGHIRVATALGIKVEWPISDAPGTSVCTLKSEL